MIPMKLYPFLVSVAMLPALAAPCAVAQNAPAEAQQAPRQRDPAEAAEYANARRVADPARRAEALEAFVKRFPNSDTKVDATEFAMLAYQQAGNASRSFEMAQRVIESEPQRVRALSVYVAQARAQGDLGPDNAREYAMQGLQMLNSWTKPADLTDAEFAKLQADMAATFNSSVAYFAMVNNDLSTARIYFQQAILFNPQSAEDTFSLGLVDVENDPVDAVGFWYIARAINLAKASKSGSENLIINYGRLRYAQFHGKLEGWTEIVKNAANQTTLPDEFTVAPSGAATDNP